MKKDLLAAALSSHNRNFLECRTDCSSNIVFKLYHTDTFSLKEHATATARMLVIVMDILVILCHDSGMSCLKLIF